ncbi:MAG: tetratricopeptide repeat protein [Bacteroidales bacterium]|nr:tetratricopeptide repeat protein [Bacteroidales bacterium]
MKELQTKVKHFSRFQAMALWPLIIFLILAGSIEAVGQTKVPFRTVDSLTYMLYEQGQWQKLIKTGNTAVKQGHDYYYMRMRLGIAYFKQQHYRLAAKHFEKALEFNSADKNAINYLYQCYQWGGLQIEAAEMTKRFPISFGTTSDTPDLIKSVAVYAGGAVSGSAVKLNDVDLDGEANIYGEVSGNGNLLYAHLGLTLAPAQHLRWYLGYTHLQLAKKQRIIFSGTDTLDNNYNLKQQQFYSNWPLRVAKGLYLIPAFDLIRISDRPYVVIYDSIKNKYDINRSEILLTNYIASLKLIKEMPHLSMGGVVSKSHLNNKDQWQTTLITAIYPFANLNLYGFSHISALIEDEILNWHFKQGLSLKILSNLWMEASYHCGHLKNAHAENGLLIFNSTGTIISRSTFTAFILLNEKLTLQLDYNFLKHQDQYLEYQDYNTYAWKPVQYNNHHIMGGLKWKF